MSVFQKEQLVAGLSQIRRPGSVGPLTHRAASFSERLASDPWNLSPGKAAGEVSRGQVYMDIMDSSQICVGGAGAGASSRDSSAFGTPCSGRSRKAIKSASTNLSLPDLPPCDLRDQCNSLVVRARRRCDPLMKSVLTALAHMRDLNEELDDDRTCLVDLLWKLQ